jgi:hypothetical protein
MAIFCLRIERDGKSNPDLQFAISITRSSLESRILIWMMRQRIVIRAVHMKTIQIFLKTDLLAVKKRQALSCPFWHFANWHVSVRCMGRRRWASRVCRAHSMWGHGSSPQDSESGRYAIRSHGADSHHLEGSSHGLSWSELDGRENPSASFPCTWLTHVSQQSAKIDTIRLAVSLLPRDLSWERSE